MYINLLTIKMYKKFPLKKILNSKDFYLKYINQKNDLLQNINFVELNKIISLLKKCFKGSWALHQEGIKAMLKTARKINAKKSYTIKR